MANSGDLTGGTQSPPRARKRQSSVLLVVAAGLLLFAVTVGVAFVLLRPVTLKIAVGPAGSDDAQIIQGLAQNFAREGNGVRLSVTTTAGPVDSIKELANGNAELAVARADEEMPEGTEAVAILRKNVVVLWTAGAPKGTPRRGAKSKVKSISDLPGHRVGVVDRTDVNARMFRVILKESGVDPDKVEVVQFGPSQINDMLKDASLSGFAVVGPIESKLVSEAIVGTARLRGEPTFLPVDVSEAIAARHPLYESEEIPGGSITTSPARPDDKVETIGVDHLIVAPKSLSETTVGALARQIFTQSPNLHARLKPHPRSRSPIPTRTRRCPPIQEPPPISTAPNAPLWTNTATTSGAWCCCSRSWVRRRPRCATSSAATSASSTSCTARSSWMRSRGRGGSIPSRSSTRCNARPTRSCVRHLIATTMARSTNPILRLITSCWSSFITRSWIAAPRLAGRPSTCRECARDSFSRYYCCAGQPGRWNKAASPQGEVSILSPS